MLDASWKLTRKDGFGWYTSDSTTVVGLWMAEITFAEAQASVSGTISSTSASSIRQKITNHSAQLSVLPELSAALDLGLLQAFRLSGDLGGGYLVVLPSGIMSIHPLAVLESDSIPPPSHAEPSSTTPLGTVTDADVEANAPSVRQLFAKTKAHILGTVPPQFSEKIAPVIDRATSAWESVLPQISRQTLECFDSRKAKNGICLLRESKLLILITTLPCSHEDTAVVFRDLCPPSDRPYISFVSNYISQYDSSVFDYLIHTVITCKPATLLMHLELGVFPNAEMKSNWPKLLPIEVMTESERKVLGV